MMTWEEEDGWGAESSFTGFPKKQRSQKSRRPSYAATSNQSCVTGGCPKEYITMEREMKAISSTGTFLNIDEIPYIERDNAIKEWQQSMDFAIGHHPECVVIN
jgi:hypothetical protein